ncbi:MAG: DUF4386 family protein [Candidatus Eisenbacteria bacterium]|nr:DUF4386 family protein [Candidatus Eisenbacteria bacterium]
MTNELRGEVSPRLLARSAGVLYLVIIVFGLFGELSVRSGLVVPGDVAATATNIVASGGLFRLGFLTDSVMFLCDVALAVLLYVLLRPVGKTVALVAMCFRLTQTAVIALNLLHYHAAMLALSGRAYTASFGPDQLNALASFFLDLHSHGYDLGLLLFGVHCLLLGYLIYRSGYLPKVLGVLLVAAGFTYLIGSYTRFLVPQYVQTVAPIYAVAIIAEVGICLWLLIRGVNVELWESASRRPHGRVASSPR